MRAPHDIAGTAHPKVESKQYTPDKTAMGYAVCPSCKTLYTNVSALAVICCRRHVSCAVAHTDEHCIDIENECPTEFAYRVVDMASSAVEPVKK